MASNLKGLIGKLNDSTRSALEAAAGFCLTRTHYDIEIEHFLMKLLEVTDSDLQHILKHFAVNKSHLATDLTVSLDKLKTGNARTPVFSPSLVQMLSEAWTIGSLDFGAAQVRSGLCVLAIAASADLARLMREVSREFQKISEETLRKNFWAIVAGSPEDQQTAQAANIPGVGPAASAGAPGGGKTQNLNQFTIDLTANARAGKVDPVLGRDHEIRQIIDILTRRRQNNPILTGEAGVGKTAVVEGFALRVAAGDVPPPLKNVTIRSLDLALLQAGAGIKGEFENRLNGLIEEVQSSPTPIILFIDEAHTMIGAGGAAGTGDAANLLKPPLARGTLRTIAATTWAEYRQYIEKDPALTRRFQPIHVDEPDVETCCIMLRGLLGPMEKHHGVRISDAAIMAAVNLSHRYIPARQLPDKAVSLLDTAAARVAISQSATPALIEDARVAIVAREAERAALVSDSDLGVDDADRMTSLDADIAALKEKLTGLESEWAMEQALVNDIRGIRKILAEPKQGDDETTAKRAELRGKFDVLEGITPEKRMIYAHVDEQSVASVVSDWTGIPVGRMVRDEIETVLKLPEILNRRVVGQSHGLAMIAKRIETSRAKLDNPSKPIGVFMLAGPSGVGKTETALALAEALYGGEQNMITINMSEFQEAHTVSSLKGAPPGYVGYGEGGRLTEAVRRKPYSVILLDEVEKAHPDVHEIFFQVFDKGIMEDGNGRRIDFKNTLIILTTNVGTNIIMGLSRDPKYRDDSEELGLRLRPALLEVFPAALLGRIVTIPYFPLTNAMLDGIVRLQLGRIDQRIRDNHGASFVYADAVIDHIVSKCNDPDSGGRMIDNIITNTLLPALSREFLKKSLAKEEITQARVTIEDNDFAYAWT